MMSDMDQRLQHAGEAWTRLFHNAKSIKTPENTNDKPFRQYKTLKLNMENLITNQPWGDTMQEKTPGTTRIYSQNVNGLQYQKDGGQYLEICQIAKEVQADILCMQEHNLDTTQHQVQQTMFLTTRGQWQRAKLTISSSPISFKGTWKPGGTAILSMGSITGRLAVAGHDRWGRWSYQTFRGQNERRITVISVYQVVAQRQALKGQFTTATQQHSLLLRQKDQVTDPREAFRRDLSDFVSTHRSNGNEILVIGDFNERIGEDPRGISKLAAQFQLEDIMHRHHQHLNEPATYARGQKRIDYALGTKAIANAVVTCGYEPFNYRFHTDHRALFLDFDTQNLFGTPTQNLAPFPLRTLHSNNIRQVTQYIQEKHRLLTQCNAFERGKRLLEPGNRHQFAERLDSDITRMSLVAEQRTQKYREPAWSLELSEARKKVAILSKWMTMGTTHLDQVHIIHKEVQDLKTPLLLPETSTECSQALKFWKRKVKEIVERSFETRESERERKIAQLEIDAQDPKSKAKLVILRNLRKAEAIAKMFQKLQGLLQKRKRAGITTIEVPENENDDPRACIHWKTIELPSEIARHLLVRNRKHFGQAHGTPFTTSPLVDHLGFTGQSAHAEAILDGSYDIANLDKSVQLLVRHLQKVENSSINQIQPSILVEDYVSKIKSWRESTSTSPSGLHLGHYKAMTARHMYSDLPEDEPRRLAITNMQEDLIALHVQLINYALERGFTYKRWTQVANAMLFKEPGNTKIHRTRVIHIYEADYNLAMGLKWRAALQLAENHNLLNPGQYGSRPSRGAHDPVFLEEIQLEISRLTRKSVLQINYDATSCYDRIIPNLAALVSRKYGVPQPVTHTNTLTLERAQYRLKTDLGLSDQTYSHQEREWPIYGTGQGSGNSPMIWCFLSSVLFDAYAKKAQGATYEFPNRSGRIKIPMIGYVDDSNGQTNMFAQDIQPTQEDLVDAAQCDAQEWHNLLQASGGALELSKCTYQALSWTFNTEGRPFAQGIAETEGICITTGPNQVQNIPEVSAHTAHKTLGHYKDPAGNQNRQSQILKEKSNKAAAFVARSPLNRDEAWTYYFAIYLPSVGYPLPNCHFTKQQLDKIQQQFMSEIIAKCGLNRKTKREIIYGPAHLGGANFRTLYSVQGVGQVTTLLRHWRSPSQAGQMLRIAIAWAQYASGISTPILEDIGTPLPHLESKWILSVRNYLKYVGATIELDDPYLTKREREHDWHIMDAIIQSGKFSPVEIQQLNYCRLYLQSITISDLANARGDALDPYMQLGKIDHPTSSKIKWHKINQYRPAAKHWLLWREALSLWSDETGMLYQPLGKWLVPPSQQRRNWLAYATSCGQVFLHNTNNDTQFKRFRITQEDQEQIGWYQVNTYIDTSSTIPEQAFPVQIVHTAQGIRLVHMGPQRSRQLWTNHYYAPPSRPMRNQDFSTYVSELDLWEFELLQYVKMDTDVFDICTQMQEGFVAACDGSVEEEKNGAFGWIIATNLGQRLVKAYGPARGNKPSSYRAEGYGVLSFHRFVVRIQEFCSVSIGNNWAVTSDNIALVNRINGHHESEDSTNHTIDRQQEVHDWSAWQEIPGHDIDDNDESFHNLKGTTTAHTMEPDWDVINEILWNRERSGIQVGKISHVRGHQDRKKAYQQLSLEAQLNVDADALAREYQSLYGQARPLVLLLPHSGANLHIAQGTCTAHVPQALRQAEHERPLAAYITMRNKWDEATFRTIDWAAHGRVIKKNNRQRIHITKLVHDLVPTNKIIHRQDPNAQICPACQSREVEDRDHVLRCSQRGRTQWRAQFITALTVKGASMNSDPKLLCILTEGLHQWLQGDDMGYDVNTVPVKYQRLVRQQNRIGWRQIFNGRMSKEWARLQSDYEFIQRQRARDLGKYHAAVASGHGMTHESVGTRWTSEIIHEIWVQWKVVWTQRNELIHGHDEQTRRTKMYQRDDQRLQTIYDSRTKMEPRVQELLFDTIDEHRQSCSQNTIHNWLAVNETTFIQSIKNVTKRALQGVRSIKSYFQRKDTCQQPSNNGGNPPPRRKGTIKQP